MASNRLKKHKPPSTAKAPKPSRKKTFDIDKIAGPKKRSRVKTEQQGINYSDQDYHGELASMSEGEVDGERGLVSNSSVDYPEADGLECETSDIMEHINEHGTDDGDEASSEDDMNDSESDSHTNVDDIASTSSFYRHVGHVITNEEADKLVKSKWLYKWEMPATGMLMSKWVGTGECLPKEVPEDLPSRINPKLYKHWLDIYKASESEDFDARLRFFFSLCNSYRDIMHCDKKPFYLKGAQEDSSIMDAYLMHALNHVFKTRDIVVKNDAKLKNHQEGGKEILTASSSLDHGFTRPKVMLLLPLGSILFRVVKKLIHLTPLSHRANVEHIDRFTKEFGNGDVEEDDDEIDESSKYKKPPKSKEFELLFSGNNSDHFMIGMKLTKRSMKLYSDFYSSDIIIASPLGLVTKIGEAEVEKEKDVDYLSSIEILIIDHADVIAMQNWSHVNTVVEQLNRTPAKQHGTDVMRIRQWYLDGHARFYRQTLLLGSFANPDMNALFNRLCLNYEGKVKLKSEYKGVLPKVMGEVRQVYERFDASSILDVDDSRLEYFCKKVYPKIKDSLEGGTMLFISSYFEFVRLRNFLKSQNASFCLLGEYTKPSDISRARVWFFEGQRKIILYTERAHFYYRYKIRGVKNLIIYSLPERKEFYPEIINMLEGSNMTCNVIFSRFDQLKLERIVGTSSSKRMLSSDKDIFVFC